MHIRCPSKSSSYYALCAHTNINQSFNPFSHSSPQSTTNYQYVIVYSVSGSAVDPLLPQVFTATVSAAGTQSGAALIAVGAAQGGSSPLGSGAVLMYVLILIELWDVSLSLYTYVSWLSY